MENRFKQLRYKDKFLLHQEISMTKLAEEMGISKATISNLERSDNYDAKISIIKKYKERFPEVSYDYLLGATYTKRKQYSRAEEELPFSNEFYEGIKTLMGFQASHDSPNLSYILEALMHDPYELGMLFVTIDTALQEIYNMKLNPEDYENERMQPISYLISEQYFCITHALTKFLDKSVSPLLNNVFEHKHIESERLKNSFRPAPVDPGNPF